MAGATVLTVKTFGKVLCSGPTNLSIDNLSSRIDTVATKVVDKSNIGGALTHHYPMVLRAYKPDDELGAFEFALRNPDDPVNAAPKKRWQYASKWTLPLSAAFWLLVLFRSGAVRSLREQDTPALHELQKQIDHRADLAGLRGVATGEMSWEDYQKGKVAPSSALKALFEQIVLCADVLCTTPALTENVELYRDWKTQRARAVVVDEAGNINRADLYCVWGNTLLPCILGGDPRQLQPAVMTTNDTDLAMNLLNRFAADGRVSPLEFLAGSGMPVYRLTTQLRMANGMFDWLAEVMYGDLGLKYGDWCSVSNPKFAAGQALEEYLVKKYPDIKPSPPGKLLPAFIDCRESRVFTDPLTKSKRSPDQVKVALDFAVDFVKTMGVSADKIRFVTPYSANVEVMRRMRKKPEYSCLSVIPDASTVDAYQGREHDIIILVLGNRHPKPGPGFMTNENRLNVAMTRAKAGLVAVGDIYACGGKPAPNKPDTEKVMDGEEGLVATSGKGKAKQAVFYVEDPAGGMHTVKAIALRQVHEKYVQFGRLATIVIREPVIKDQPAPVGNEPEEKEDEKAKKKKKNRKKKGKKDPEEKEVAEEEAEEEKAKEKEAPLESWADDAQTAADEKEAEAKPTGKGKGKGKEAGPPAVRQHNQQQSAFAAAVKASDVSTTEEMRAKHDQQAEELRARGQTFADVQAPIKETWRARKEEKKQAD